MKSKNNKILIMLGYFWVIIGSLWTIYEILDASFGLTPLLSSKKISFLVVLLFLAVSTIGFLCLYWWKPSLITWLSIGLSDEEKYFHLSSEGKLNHSTLLNNFNLNYLNNELNLLEPIRDLLGSEQYERAVEYGVWASETFLRMNNHFVRVLNGLYTLMAVQRLQNTQISNRNNRCGLKHNLATQQEVMSVW